MWLTSHLSRGPGRRRVSSLLPQPSAAIICWVSSSQGPSPLLGSAWAQDEEMLVQGKKEGQTRAPLCGPRWGGRRLLNLSGNVRDENCDLSLLTCGGCPRGALPPGPQLQLRPGDAVTSGKACRDRRRAGSQADCSASGRVCLAARRSGLFWVPASKHPARITSTIFRVPNQTQQSPNTMSGKEAGPSGACRGFSAC